MRASSAAAMPSAASAHLQMSRKFRKHSTGQTDITSNVSRSARLQVKLLNAGGIRGPQRTCPAQKAPAQAPGLLPTRPAQPAVARQSQMLRVAAPCRRMRPALPPGLSQAAHQTAAPHARPGAASPALLRSCRSPAWLLMRAWAAGPPDAAACCQQQGRMLLPAACAAGAPPPPTSCWPGRRQGLRVAAQQPPVSSKGGKNNNCQEKREIIPSGNTVDKAAGT